MLARKEQVLCLGNVDSIHCNIPRDQEEFAYICRSIYEEKPYNKLLATSVLTSLMRENELLPLGLLLEFVASITKQQCIQWQNIIHAPNIPFEVRVEQLVALNRYFQEQIAKISQILSGIYDKKFLYTITNFACYGIIVVFNDLASIMPDIPFQRIAELGQIIRTYERLILMRLDMDDFEAVHPQLNESEVLNRFRNQMDQASLLKTEAQFAKAVSAYIGNGQPYEKFINMLLVDEAADLSKVYRCFVFFKYIKEHHMFVLFHWRYLSSRLLKQTRFNSRVEMDIINEIVKISSKHLDKEAGNRIRCMKYMLSDVMRSQEQVRLFGNYNIKIVSEKYGEVNNTKLFNNFRPIAIRPHNWPEYNVSTIDTSKLQFAPQQQVQIDAYTMCYRTAFPTSKLRLEANYGFAVVRFTNDEGQLYHIIFTVPQWAILSHFSVQQVWTVSKLAKACGMSKKLVSSVMQTVFKETLFCKTGDPESFDLKNDKFKFNTSFESANKEISLVANFQSLLDHKDAVKRQAQEEEKQLEEDATSEYVLSEVEKFKAIVIRMSKKVGIVTLNQLNKLQATATTDSVNIGKICASLVEQEYLAPVNNGGAYRYLP
jgi:hypothetical protein